MNRYIERSRKTATCTQESEIIVVCGRFGHLTKQQVHDHIREGSWIYYSRAPGAPDARVRAMGNGPNRYIQTDADGLAANNLVNLPDC